MATRGISANVRPFPNPGNLKTVGEVSSYLNTLGGWLDSRFDQINRLSRSIAYAPYDDMPPVDGPSRFVQVPNDPTYGQVLAYNGTGTGGTLGWNRLVPAGTIGGAAVSIPAGGTTSQVLGKHSTADYDVAWQTPQYVPAGGTTGQALRKTSTADYAAAWSDVHELTTGGTAGQVLAKNSGTNYDAAWVTPHYLTTGGTTGQVLTKNSTADYDASWKDTARPAFIGALAYSTSTQTLTSGTDARLSLTSTVYDLGTFFSTANPTRLTVGSGVSYVQVEASVSIVDGTAGTAGTRHAEIWKNGSAMGTGLAQVSVYAAGNDTVALNVSSPVLPVGSGDYFELNVGQASGTAATISPAGASWLALKVIQ